MFRTKQYALAALILGTLAFVAVFTPFSAPPLHAAPVAAPSQVSVPGSFNSEIGCTGDWQPDCAQAQLSYDADDDVWQGTKSIPADSYEYKAALNNSFDVSYGKNGTGDNIPLSLGAATNVKFYYDDKSHWITDNVNSVIATAVGDFQSELGCPADWSPDCLRSWLQDIDGNGIYTFETTALPADTYHAKVAINESWDENYGAGGTPGGSDIPFTVAVDNSKVTFKYNATTHVLTILAGHAPDDNVEADGLRHDSRSLIYRTPGGAVPVGTPVTIRFRTFHDDVSSVKLRVYDVNANGQQVVKMELAASDVTCYQDDLSQETCDYWAYTLPNTASDNYWYRFIVTDGTATTYYADDTAALDGGLGAPSGTQEDRSWALMIYEPSFAAPNWAKSAVVYQIFPDRFSNGDPSNDPQTGDLRYDDPVYAMDWGDKPEGYCRNYADGNSNCPWRFDNTPPADSPTKEQPRGRDYYGGDLQGVINKLDYLADLGITAIYFNPIFDAQSNHRYDTANYSHIDPALGDNKLFEDLVQAADQRGIRIILDGVFNHESSDGPRFDRYHHYDKTGACEKSGNKYRSWFVFRPPAGNEPSPCKPSTAGGDDTYYEGWFGFDSIPVLVKTNPKVQKKFISGKGNVTAKWLKRGASAWRMDVMGDASFPDGYWETFRSTVKTTKADALIVGELWQKDTTLLRFLRGDRADSTMNYRLRDAVLGYLTPGAFDSKGFADSGNQIAASDFSSRLESIREDYSDATYYSLMNLLDSHDTERLLWTLTPGAETTADREENPANVANGKARMRLAALIQYTLPGMPTLYYGDERGVTGDDDPDDRRTMPWNENQTEADKQLRQYYTSLANLRKDNKALVNGAFQVLYVNDGDGTVAYGRKNDSRAMIVALNRTDSPKTLDIPRGSFVASNVAFATVFGEGNVNADNDSIEVQLGAMSGIVLATGEIDLTPPAAPTNLHVTNEGSMEVALAWDDVPDAVSYNVYRSVLSGGGFEKINNAPLKNSKFKLSRAESTNGSSNDTGLENATTYYYVVTAVDAAGNESAWSNEVSALPHYGIGWANTQFPQTLTHTISATTRTATVYGQVYIENVTSAGGATEGLMAQLGFGPQGSNPDGNNAWTWVTAEFNTDSGNNDEYRASLLPETTGTFNYLYRYSTTNGRDWLYADLSGPVTAGATPSNPGVLTVNPSLDTQDPPVPQNLRVTSVSPTAIDLEWDAVSDGTLYGYRVWRGIQNGGPYYDEALVTSGTTYHDNNVAEGMTYYYVVTSVDTSFNESQNSNQVDAKAEARTVSLHFNVTVPATTDATGRSVYIAGFLDRLDGGLPQWDAGGVVLTRADATHWTITLTGKEGVQIEYKYTLGSFDYVEKGAACDELSNRQLTLTYGADGNQDVNDTVLNWRNVAPCGN